MQGRAITLILYVYVVLCCSLILSTHVLAQESVNIGVGVGDTVLDISGQSSPHAFISIYSGQGLIATVTADGSGDFNGSVAARTPGITRLTLSGRDTENRLTDAVTVEVNLQEHTHTAVHVFLPTTLELSALTMTEGQTLGVRGRTYPSANISLFVDNQTAGTVKAAPDGSWSMAIGMAAYSSGLHGIFTRVSDNLGGQSFSTVTQSFILTRSALEVLPIPTKPPTIPPINPAPAAPRILSPSDKYVSRQSRVVISGQGPARTQIEVLEDGRVIGSVFSDFSGAWALPYTFSDGSHTIRARSCTADRCSGYSNQVSFSYQSNPSGSPRLRARLEKQSYSLIQSSGNNKATLRLSINEGAPLFQVNIDWGDKSKSSLTSSDRDISASHSYAEAGKYTGRVLIRNPLGSQELFFTVNVAVKRPSTTLLAPIYIGGAATALLLVHHLIYRFHWPRSRTR